MSIHTPTFHPSTYASKFWMHFRVRDKHGDHSLHSLSVHVRGTVYHLFTGSYVFHWTGLSRGWAYKSTCGKKELPKAGERGNWLWRPSFLSWINNSLQLFTPCQLFYLLIWSIEEPNKFISFAFIFSQGNGDWWR